MVAVSRHGRGHTPEQAADHDDLEREPDFVSTAIYAGVVIVVALGVGWVIGRG